MANELAERHSVAIAASSFLQGKGWGISGVQEGFKVQATLTLPTVALHFLPSNLFELQMGRTGGQSVNRRIQFDCYMETEDRAIAIREDIGLFLDGMWLNIVDPLNSNVLGAVSIPDTESIRLDTMPPILSDPKIKRWRSIIQASMEANYY